MLPATAVNGEHPYTSEKAGLNFMLFVPELYGEDPKQLWPLILFLHGAGTRGENLNQVLYEALPQRLTFQPDFPFLVVSPQILDQDGYWTSESIVQSLFTLLDEVQADFAVDPEHIYLTGVSLGGGGVWGIGLHYPGRFAALVPVMGFYGIPFEVPPNICDLKDTPIWAFHGDQDPIVPLSAETGLVDAVQACGGDARITIYPGEHHDISGKVYSDPELYKWMLEQSTK